MESREPVAKLPTLEKQSLKTENLATDSRKAIFFDLGNVLMFFSHAKMYEQLGRLLQVSPSVIQREFRDNGLGNKYECGQIDTKTFHRHLCQVTGKEASLEDVLDATSDIFDPNQAILPLLEELKSKGHKLFILSNTNEAHFSYTAKRYPQMLAPFDGYVLSYEVGAIKPQEIIFNAALKKANAKASQCFYTDDIPDFIEAAARVNIQGVVFTGIDPLIEALRFQGLL